MLCCVVSRAESRRFRIVSPNTKRLFVHHFAISSPDELDAESAGWAREAHDLGVGRHLEDSTG